MHGLVWVIEINESLKSIKERLVLKGAIPIRAFHVDYLNFRPKNKASGIQPLSLFHHSQFPLSSFLFSPPSSTTGKQAKCVADRGFDLILPKLKGGIEPDHVGYFESNGMEYKLNDFKIRVGVVTMANSTSKGTTLEVEYMPTSHVEGGAGSLMQFTNALINDGVKRKPTHFKDRRAIYAPLDTMSQYKSIFTEMRNRTSSSSYNG